MTPDRCPDYCRNGMNRMLPLVPCANEWHRRHDPRVHPVDCPARPDGDDACNTAEHMRSGPTFTVASAAGRAMAKGGPFDNEEDASCAS